MTDPRVYLAWALVILLIIVTAAKTAAGYYAASATSRLGSSAAQRGIAYGVMFPSVSYALFVFAVFPIPGISTGDRQAAALLGMMILACSALAMTWGWHRYDHVLQRVFNRQGDRISEKEEG